MELFLDELLSTGMLLGLGLTIPLGFKLRPSFFRWETAQAFKKFRREMILALIGFIIFLVCWLLLS